MYLACCFSSKTFFDQHLSSPSFLPLAFPVAFFLCRPPHFPVTYSLYQLPNLFLLLSFSLLFQLFLFRHCPSSSSITSSHLILQPLFYTSIYLIFLLSLYLLLSSQPVVLAVCGIPVWCCEGLRHPKHCHNHREKNTARCYHCSALLHVYFFPSSENCR